MVIKILIINLFVTAHLAFFIYFHLYIKYAQRVMKFIFQQKTKEIVYRPCPVLIKRRDVYDFLNIIKRDTDKEMVSMFEEEPLEAKLAIFLNPGQCFLTILTFVYFIIL